MHSSRSYSFILIIVFVVPIGGLLAFNLYTDPFQIAHKDLTKPDVIIRGYGFERYQHAGVINQYDMDAIILGHSHAANYLPSKVSREFGVKNVFSLTMNGAYLYEQKHVASYALKKHDVKFALWGFSTRNLLHNPKKVNKKSVFNEYLYDDSRLNDQVISHFFI